MRGAFVARFGGGPETSRLLEQIAGRFRWHQGAYARHELGALEVAVLADADHGPDVSIDPGVALVVHGAAAAPLGHLQGGSSRFAALELSGGRLRASRDLLGEAPLFFRFAHGAAWLATEIHPLAALASAEPDLAALSADAAFVPYVLPTGRTGILRVPPGSTLEIAPDLTYSIDAYWRPDRLLATNRCGYAEAVDEFRNRFQLAVDRRRVPGTGVLLSGGLDSAAVAVAAAAHANGNPPRLLTVTFPELPETDESAYARATAEAAGLPLGVVHGRTDRWDPSPEPEIFGTAPVLVPTSIFEVAARRFLDDGYSTVLDGHDGDGALGLYTGIYGLLVAHMRVRSLLRLGRLLGWRSTASLAVRQTVSPTVKRVRGLTGAVSEDDGLISRLLPYFRGETARRMVDELRVYGPRRSWRRFQLLPLTPPLTLVFEQMETEAARLGVDVQHPFADPDLLRFLVTLPFQVKVDPERAKPLLRDGLADLLPDAVRSRRGKVWFNAVLEHRVDPADCLERIRDSGISFPDFDYEAFFRAADEDLDFPTVFGWIRLVRAHVAAAAAR